MSVSVLRRLRGHVGAQNWFAVTIDVLIVVLGVFIGIEVANWNQGRQDRAEERRYYRHIRDDLAADVEAFRTAQERSEANDRNAEIALAALDGRPPPDLPAGRVAQAFHRGAFLYIPLSSRATYDELISTGSLGLLRDPVLKGRIVDYYASFAEARQWDAVMRDYQKEYWVAAAGVLPRKVLQASIRGRAAQVTDAELDKILAQARSRAGLRHLLVGMAADQERVRRDSEFAERRARRLIDAIDARLGGSAGRRE